MSTAQDWPEVTVQLTRRWPPQVEAHLASRCRLILRDDDTPMSVSELQRALESADVLCPTVTDHLPAGLFKTGQRCRLLANFGAGVNHIPLPAVRESGKLISNTPDVLTDCTADLTLMLMLMVARRAGEGERELRRGAWTGWRPTHLLGTRVSGQRLGIVGMGRIGRAVAARASVGFGMQVGYYSRSEVSGLSFAAQRFDDLSALLGRSDFVSLHCPATDETRHLMNERTLRQMPAGGFLINTSRGDVVDESALVAALEEGHLAGAGLDVYAGEPAIEPSLLQRDDVVLLPHLGSATTATREAMGMRVVANVERYLNEGGLLDPVG